MSGRGNTGPAFCTLVPLKDLSEEVTGKVLTTFNMELVENVAPPSSNSQDFPFTQSQSEDTLMVCQVCRFATRDKTELQEHLSEHHKCGTCGQFYGTQEELNHHVLNHEKIKCDQCNKLIRKDELLTHQMNHLKLKTFGKKIVKTKSVKPVTGYGLWQKEERKRILQAHPQMLYTDVGRELGRRWALIGAEEKTILKKQAEDFNKALKEKEMPEDDYLDPVPSTSGVGTGTNEFEINNDDIRVEIGDETSAAIDDELNASNQNYVNVDDLLNLSIEDIQPARKRKKTVDVADTECSLCDFKAKTNQDLANHMKNHHAFTQQTIIQCDVCKQLFSQKSKLEKHVRENHEAIEDQEMEIVLVKQRTLAWPAVVVKRQHDVIELKMIADDSKKIVKQTDIIAFYVDRISNTKTPKLKQAFAKAVDLLKK